MAPRRNASNLFAAVALVAAVLPGAALGLPKEGTDAPDARVVDIEGHELKLAALRGKPVLIVYEDKESAKQNQPLKNELSQLTKGERYKSRIALTAIADVSGYDWWPAKGFIKDAIKEESKKHNTTIYCDWDGSFRKALKLRSGVSNVILIGRDGKVIFAGEGELGNDARKRLIDLLGDQTKD
jgi:predicted transcriptional regulator